MRPKDGRCWPGARVQQLHLVGFTTDIEGLIFSTRRGSRSGGYMVVLDDRLLERIEEALRLRNEDAAENADPPDSRRPLRAPSNGNRRSRSESTVAADGRRDADDGE